MFRLLNFRIRVESLAYYCICMYALGLLVNWASLDTLPRHFGFLLLHDGSCSLPLSLSLFPVTCIDDPSGFPVLRRRLWCTSAPLAGIPRCKSSAVSGKRELPLLISCVCRERHGSWWKRLLLLGFLYVHLPLRHLSEVRRPTSYLHYNHHMHSRNTRTRPITSCMPPMDEKIHFGENTMGLMREYVRPGNAQQRWTRHWILDKKGN